MFNSNEQTTAGVLSRHWSIARSARHVTLCVIGSTVACSSSDSGGWLIVLLMVAVVGLAAGWRAFNTASRRNADWP